MNIIIRIFHPQHPCCFSSRSGSCRRRHFFCWSKVLVPLGPCTLALTSLMALSNYSKAVSTFSDANAEVSTNINPFLSAKAWASSISTCRLDGFCLTLSILFPTNITYMSGSDWLIKFSIHVSSSSNVSLDVIS